MILRRHILPPKLLPCLFLVFFLTDPILKFSVIAHSSGIDEFTQNNNNPLSETSKNVKHLITDVDKKCPKDWHHLDNKCYRLYPIERSWPQALAFCSRFGAVLARIETQKENAFISKLLAKPLRSASASTKHEFWIGLLSQHSSTEDSLFVWSDGSFVSRYIGFWAKNQPDHRGGSCTKSTLEQNNNLAWRLEMCNSVLPFICEIPSCVKNQFFCHNGGCVPEKAHCNGVDDCGDMSDELNCPASRPELACLKHERGESGRIESPNFPSSYSPNANCRYVIEGPINSRIQLTFDSFETEENQDFVTVLDGGPAENSTIVLAQLSGTPKAEDLTFTSSSNILIISFRSDALIQARGFQANWKAIQLSCGGALKAQSYAQTFTSPEFPRTYPNGLECVWTIDAPAGNLISLNIESFELEENRDFLILYDGAGPYAPILGRFTGTIQRNDDVKRGSVVAGSQAPIITTQNQLYIYFFTNQDLSKHQGFSISYKKGCENIIRSSYGSIVSPGNLALPYPSSQLCKYTIELPDMNNEQSITLSVNYFDVAPNDALRLYEGGSNGRALHEENGFNGKVKPPKTIYTTQGKIELEFFSTVSKGSLGWNMTFSTNCPALVVHKFVSISTQNTAYGTKVTVSCGRGFEFVTGRGRFFDIHCGLGGQWSEAVLPQCQPVYCAPVPQIANGFAISATNVTFGGMARYGCYEGFSFTSGKKTEEVFCTDEGRWTATPQCRAETCGVLSSFTNGERALRFGDGIGYGSVYSFKCDAGYQREGAATILCQSDGRWSSSQPYCKKLSCTKIPKIENGRVLLDPSQLLYFGDSARIECNSGFRNVGADLIKCLANQTLDGIPRCEDIDECVESFSSCATKTTNCINFEGGYHCQCKQGFQSLTSCTNAAAISPISIKPSSGSLQSTATVFALSNITVSAMHGKGWCSSVQDSTPSLTLTFSSAKIVERLRIERVGNSFPTQIRLYYANEIGIPLKLYRHIFGTNVITSTEESIVVNSSLSEEAAATVISSPDILTIGNIASTGSEILTLARPIEARVIRIEIVSFEERPCAKIDAIGCQKTSCIDINECEENNGYCEHYCHNLQGSHRCSCQDGYDLFVSDGQGGITLTESESGMDNLDALRFNKSCVARRCTSLNPPENGKIVSSLNENGQFEYPQVVEFACNFGYQMRGSSHLTCLADRTWNGTIPFCIPAVCSGVKNNTAIGLFIQPESAAIGYGQNVTILCSQQNRPAKFSTLSGSRQCIYDPRPDGTEYWLSGPEIDCPLVDCGPPPTLAGSYYEGGDEDSNKVGGTYLFHCRAPYVLVGKSSYDDRMIRCNVDGTWDLGDLRCEGPVCPDPGNPAGGETHLQSVEESAIARFTCNRPGFKPFPHDAINCTLGTPCVLSEDVGISTGYIPDGAFGDNSDSTIWGYEPHKSRMSSTGWCGSKDAFIFLSVDLQRIYTLTNLRLAGVAGSGHLKGHVTKLQLFHKVQFSQNYDNYAGEFTTLSGNHNKMYQFTLNPPIRARYILLGITEYENNPCLKFDLQGCLAPLSPSHEIPSHLQVGWNASIPQCIDSEPPIFTNCPQSPIYVSTDEHGQLLPVNYAIPEAIDNSGIIAHIQVTPENFEPPWPIHSNVDVTYTAFDEAGNAANCVVRLRIPDTQPPVMKCPDSYSLWAEENEYSRKVYFNESTVKQLVVQDLSNITELRFDPPEVELKLDTHVTVDVSATDVYLNQNKCKFQVALMPEPCSAWSLRNDEKSTIKKCSKHITGTMCTVECRPGYRFVDAVGTGNNNKQPKVDQQKFTCSFDGKWNPSNTPIACVAASQEPARYELKMTVDYISNTPVPSDCLEGYEYLASAFFDSIDSILTQRCSSSIQVFVRFLGVKFNYYEPSSLDRRQVSSNYTVQILPTVLQKVFYQLCGLTLQTIFDLKIPGATAPIRNLLSLSGDAVTVPFTGTSGGAPGCPSMNASSVVTWQGFDCSSGEILQYNDLNGDSSDLQLPECLPCPKGTVFVNSSCIECPRGSFQDEDGKSSCKPCPDNTFTLSSGSQSLNACLPICGSGMFSGTGAIPCQLCPRHTFSLAPIPGGYKECEACPEGTFTARLGSISANECKLPCKAGHFSTTGLEPCSPCGVNHYQSNIGQQKCIQCPNNTMTRETGRISEKQCQALDCSSIKCQNKGNCVIRNHKAICECRPGFMGKLCEESVPICDSKPCLNSGLCEPFHGTFRCICAQNYTGSKCQFGPDECIGVNCPNGGVCQDLPGIGTAKCVCRTGFTGSDCSEIQNPCQSKNPCRNGADCIPLQLGRYKCKCLPGWTGPNCEQNIDDCAENPCALSAKCHDLINDFECECPHGFVGKRCNVKANLCDPDPCLNGGVCIDSLFSRKCLCKEGWNGTFCEQNIDECASSPCQNGATCRDKENGYVCECAPGFYGLNCQHMVDHCAVSPCRNNATCINKGANYACECRLGFEGIHCEHNVDECAILNLCDEQGTETCEDLVNDFVCHCRSGYTGELCKTRVNECDLEPCQNNGTCMSTGSGFECECKPGWRGERCQEIETQHCDHKPCQNDGKCVTLVNDFFCVCPEGVNGKRCEIAPNRCIGEPCHNGGVCGDFGSRQECMCPKGYTGKGCQYKIDACRPNTCKNGATCVEDSHDLKDVSSGYRCICAPGFTGTECETNIDECSPSPCPLAATCIDQLNTYHCQCPFNTTSANCEKKVDPDYDLHFYDTGVSTQPSRASLSVPFVLSTDALSLSIWVRFARRRGKGTVLTMYHSRLSNYATNLTELLRVTGESVRLSLFEDLTPLVLRFPANQRLNDGQWNNLVITWQARNGGEYSLIWNSVRLYIEKGYGADRRLVANGYINLGDPLSEAVLNPHAMSHSNVKSTSVERFVGSITRVNLWSRVLDFEQEIPNIVQRCQNSPTIYNGLILHFAEYNLLVGKVERITKSQCGRMDNLSHSPQFMSVGAAVTPFTHSVIQVASCPGDIFVVTPLREVNVTWAEPLFVSMDPVHTPLERVEQNLKSGHVFTWGEYNVIYATYANDSSVAECSFKINIAYDFCPEVEDPVNGVQSCENWGPNLKYRACSIQCENDYAFSRQPAVFYTCANDGVWRPREFPTQRKFKYPQCTKAVPAERISRIQLSYPNLKLCNNAGKNTFTERILQRIYHLNSIWNICAITNNNTSCDGVKIYIDCNAASTSDNESSKFLRHRRSPLTDNGTSKFDVRIEILVRRYAVFNSKSINNGNDEGKLSIVEVIENETLTNDLFNLEKVLPNGRPDLNSFRIRNIYNCKIGHVSVDDMCVPCAPGSFYNFESDECELCSVGYYQPNAGQTTCEVCPEHRSVTSGTGAIRSDECKAKCEAGHFYNVDHNACEACGNGFYQPATGAFECLACGIGKTTLEVNAVSEDECRDECPDGEQLTKSGICQPCPMGTYRSKGINKRCTECSTGTTTEGIRATRKSQCNTPKCVAGQFLIAISKKCQLCPRGAYQDEPLQATCKLCPPDFTTAAEGATHESQCYSTNQCKMGEDNCSWKATCIDLPDENDVPSFRCECNPGYRGNGTYCIDACLNHCLNDGVCHKNKVTGHEECACKENFSGDRCEIRYQPRSQKLTFWVATIGASVLLLIVIVVVIGMISIRFNRSERQLLSMEKPSILGLDSPMAANFLYARPALDRAHSGMVFNAETNSMQRPTIGFYYEDDALYEQQNNNANNHDSKSIFLGVDSNNMNVIATPSRNGNDSTDDCTLTDSSEIGAGGGGGTSSVSATPAIAVTDLSCDPSISSNTMLYSSTRVGNNAREASQQQRQRLTYRRRTSNGSDV